jgi:hypothetical protein
MASRPRSKPKATAKPAKATDDAKLAQWQKALKNEDFQRVKAIEERIQAAFPIKAKK